MNFFNRADKNDTAGFCSGLFNNIKDLFPCGRIAVTEIQSDFEAAVWSAVKEVFPQVTHIGCHFHWCQAQIRRVKNSFS